MSFYVVFLHGPAAAGKRTVGVQVAEALGIPLFHNHLIVDPVKALFEFGTESFRELRAALWRESFRAAARARRSFVFTFHPEATVDRTLIDELEAIVREAAGRVLFVELTCADDVVLERIGNEDRRRFGKLVDGAIYREIQAAGGFEFAALPEAILTVDTAADTPSEAAAKIVPAVRQAVG